MEDCDVTIYGLRSWATHCLTYLYYANSLNNPVVVTVALEFPVNSRVFVLDNTKCNTVGAAGKMTYVDSALFADGEGNLAESWTRKPHVRLPSRSRHLVLVDQRIQHPLL